ncbi:MAG: hypothetical protein QXQ94_10725 [Candidatus Bathyarchaeia archaeon]
MSEEKTLEKLYEELEEQIKLRKKKAFGKVISIQLGTLSQFIPEAKLRNPAKASQKALQLIVQTPDNYQIRKCMSISSHPNSSLQRYRLQYGHYPQIGDEIALIFDSSTGFWRVAI